MAENKLSEFQKKKILRVFNILYDSNKDGVIGKEDFEISIKKICRIMNWTDNTERQSFTRNTLELIWTGLQDYADTNDDHKVSIEEWTKMWSDCIQEDKFPPWQEEFMKFMFDVNDKTGDEKIDEEEFSYFYEEYCQIPKEDGKRAFQKLANGEKISRDLYKQLWKDYFVSTDESAKSTYLFGVPDFIWCFCALAFETFFTYLIYISSYIVYGLGYSEHRSLQSITHRIPIQKVVREA